MKLRLFPKCVKLQIGDNVIIISDKLKTPSGKSIPAQIKGIIQKLDPISVWTYDYGDLYSIYAQHIRKI